MDRETNIDIEFDIPDECRHCIDNCPILKEISEYKLFPNPDLVYIYCDKI